MANGDPAARLYDGVALLERAVNYAFGSLHLVTPEAMANPTPCQGWDLHALLRHLVDSLSTLHEAYQGRVALPRGSSPVRPGGAPGWTPDDGTDLAATVRDRARTLLAVWAGGEHRDELVSIAGRPLPASIVVGTGALEVAVHGWDVAQACGRPRAIPEPLAAELLRIAPGLVAVGDRPGRFAAPVAVPPGAAPGDRLVAFLGRRP